MFDAKRRRFLEWAGTSAVALAFLPPGRSLAEPAPVAAPFRRIVGFGRAIRASTGKYAHFVSIADLGAATVLPMEIPFFGHGCSFDPIAPHRVVIFEKRGDGCCEVDWKAQEVIRLTPPRPGHTYYGHGAHSPDGRQIFAAETAKATGDGVVVILDRAGKELDTFPSFGSKPHDLHLIDEGRVLVVANAGGTLRGEAPSVAYVDVRSQKLLEKTGPADPLVNMGHIGVGAKGDLVMISAPRDGLPEHGHGGVALRLPGGKPKQMPTSTIKGAIGEALSVCIDERRRLAAVTHPSGDLLTIWDLDAQKLRASISLADVRGAVHAGDGEHLVVNYGPGALALFSWERLQLAKKLDLGMTPFSGSHLYQLPTV